MTNIAAGKSRWAILLIGLFAGACGPRHGPSLVDVTRAERVAEERLIFHEDRFLADHNEKLARAWRDYVRARAKLVDLWRAHLATVYVDPQRRSEEEKAIRLAKRNFIRQAERLRKLSQDMASEAAQLLESALRVPPELSEHP